MTQLDEAIDLEINYKGDVLCSVTVFDVPCEKPATWRGLYVPCHHTTLVCAEHKAVLQRKLANKSKKQLCESSNLIIVRVDWSKL